MESRKRLPASRITSRTRQRRRDTSRTKRDIRRTESERGHFAGAYRLVEALPAGAGSELYLAERRRTNAPPLRVLLEIVKNDGPDAAWEQAALLARAELLAAPHPNWVSLIDAGEASDGAYLAVELVEGESLDKLLARLRQKHSTVSVEIACYLILEILRGVEAAASAIREISTAEILISRTGQVKLSHTIFTAESAPPRAVRSVQKILRELLLGSSRMPEDANASSRELERDGVPSGLIAALDEELEQPSKMSDALERWLSESGKSLTPSMAEKYFRAPIPRILRGRSAVVAGVSPVEHTQEDTERKIATLEKGRRVREKRAPDSRDVLDGVVIVEGRPERVPSLVRVRPRIRRQNLAPPPPRTPRRKKNIWLVPLVLILGFALVVSALIVLGGFPIPR